MSYDFLVGKSTAARCALSLCGQDSSGHMIKTKSTSDSIAIERCCKSTIPFILDNPKSADRIGELLVDPCSGRMWTQYEGRTKEALNDSTDLFKFQHGKTAEV